MNPARISQVVSSSEMNLHLGWLDPEPHCLDFKLNPHSPLRDEHLVGALLQFASVPCPEWQVLNTVIE